MTAPAGLDVAAEWLGLWRVATGRVVRVRGHYLLGSNRLVSIAELQLDVWFIGDEPWIELGYPGVGYPDERGSPVVLTKWGRARYEQLCNHRQSGSGSL